MVSIVIRGGEPLSPINLHNPHTRSLTPDDYFNVLKLQNGIDIEKSEV